ncbi:MAG: GGDEF domain-containing protein [Sphingomonadales bacterium]|nr:GGDEF domain-containing protein [Sphingomonadales bacterium]MDE2570264.1 GGDEF domain-containing protein [Sphingomonadales bacterium]
MTTHDPALESYSHRLRRWFGFEPGEAIPANALHPREALPHRSRLLVQIERFLDDLEIDVTGSALAIAHDCVTGSNAELARRVAARRKDGHEISLSWLERMARETCQDRQAAAVGALVEQLEAGIEEFGSHTRTASKATRDYKNALHRHVDELEQAGETGTVFADLLTMGRAMLARTLQIESRLERSEKRTQELQKNLEDARRAAEVDHLTQLPNRRAFERLYEDQYRSARSVNDPLCIAFCDIDHFKAINDTHGHAAGDRVLRTVAGMLARISNDKCHVARHGGEEFAVLFRGETLAEAQARLDQARVEMAERRLVNRATDEPFGQITFSAGIADALAWQDRRAALRAADQALYAAKTAGRNRVVAAPAAPVTGK